MKTAVLLKPLRALRPSRITGPIFEKELRVSSRRKRNYILRFVYLAILLVAVLLIWESEFRYIGNSVYRASKIYEVGLVITLTVVMVQFIAAQILAVVMLSNSISDEVYHKTLGTLMSTPINSFQIVMGKLLSKLLQIALMVGVSLPMLAIIRVFGGVPWSFLLMTLSITLTAVIFAGLLSLNISINHKHAYMVIILTVLALFLFYVVLPLFASWVSYEYFDVRNEDIMTNVALTNPLFLMYVMAFELFNPGITGLIMTDWWKHCLIMLGASSLLFMRAIIVVRKRALLQACGQIKVSRRKWNILRLFERSDKIKRVKGDPLVWKELRKSTFNFTSVRSVISIVSILGCVLFSYYLCEKEDFLDDQETHMIYCLLFLFLGVFVSTVFSATSITSEKASRSLPVLLTTLVTDWQIVTAKTVGMFRRSLPVWALLFAHVIIFTISNYIHWSAFVQIAIIAVGAIMFVGSSGIFFSSLLKNTTSAVVANLIFVAVVWAVIPFLAVFIGEMLRMNDDLFELVVAFNPFYHIGMVLYEAAGNGAVQNLSQLDYDCLIMKSGYSGTTAFLAFTSAGYCAVSFVFLLMAKSNLRRNIF